MNKNIRNTLDDLKTASISGTIAATITGLIGATIPVVGIVGIGMFIAVMLFPSDKDD